MDTATKAIDLAASIRSKAKPTGAADELKVDPFFEEDPAASRAIDYGILNHLNVLVVGPTGCGKSSLVINRLARLKQAAELFNCSVETSTDGLIGKPWIITEGGQSITTTIYGAGLRAYKFGKVLMLEEVDFAMSDVLASLHRIMEVNQNFYVSNIGEQEIIPKHPKFSVVSTANTIGTGENSFIYNGTKPLNEAFKDRYAYTVIMDYLSPTKEINVLVNKTGIDKNVASVLVQCANDVRDAANPTRIKGVKGTERIIATISTRSLICWAMAIKGMGLNPMEAARLSFLNRTNDADRDFMITALQNRGIK
jgi:cobaltochelatase CobS